LSSGRGAGAGWAAGDEDEVAGVAQGCDGERVRRELRPSGVRFRDALRENLAQRVPGAGDDVEPAGLQQAQSEPHDRRVLTGGQVCDEVEAMGADVAEERPRLLPVHAGAQIPLQLALERGLLLRLPHQGHQTARQIHAVQDPGGGFPRAVSQAQKCAARLRGRERSEQRPQLGCEHRAAAVCLEGGANARAGGGGRRVSEHGAVSRSRNGSRRCCRRGR
jgi:hypothetical protein